MNLEEKVQTYFKIEEQLKNKLAEVQKLREYKQFLNTQILAELEKEEVNVKHFPKTNIKCKVYQYKSSNPLTFTFLKTCLSQIISKSQQVDQIIDYVKSKRNHKIISDIKRINE